MKKNKTLKNAWLWLLPMAMAWQPGMAQPAQKRPNILMIAVDDLRPELGIYGQSHVQSPNIDRLAASGVVFDRAYCNVPVCGASRASLLTGIRPGYHRFLKYYTRADVEAPGIATLPAHFKSHGYTTLSVGKVFHTPADSEKAAWSETPYRLDHHLQADGTWSGSGWQNYRGAENKALAQANPRGAAKPWERTMAHDTAYFDGQYANKAIAYLEQLKNNDAPFFLAVGFLKPHLPFNAPKRYWDMYDADKIALAGNPAMPSDAPAQAHSRWGELRAYHQVPKQGAVSDDMARTLRHGYYACVSYTDALVGQVLDALERTGLAENTIVVLWGDHGWNLGEHGLWCKHVNFHTALQTTLVMAGPGVAQGRSSSIVELVDLYPTLLAVCGLAHPAHPLGGVSIAPILANPGAKVKSYGLAQWTNGLTYIGERYMYTEWRDKARKTIAKMLYDRKTDPGENRNIAGRPENARLVGALGDTLRNHLGQQYWQPAQGHYPGR